MHDLLHKTGPYLHAPDDVSRLSFETGGTPRVFTLLIAAATETTRADRSAGGIVILDEDEGAVVLDGHLGGDPGRDAEFYRIRGMGWTEFSDFCRTHQRFRGRAPDLIDPLERPLPGSRRRQAALPEPLSLRDRVGDLRSDLMIRTQAGPDGSVTFPRIGRTQAIDELSQIPLITGHNGLVRMSWPIRFPDHCDLSGLQGDRPVDRALDPAWSELLAQRPELVEEARLEAIGPALDGSCLPPGSEGSGRFGLLLCPQGRGGVILATLDESVFAFADHRSVRAALVAMPDSLVRDLWGLKRSLDHATSPDRLETRFGAALNRIRSELELARDPEPAPAGP